MNNDSFDKQEKILLAALEDVPFDGWSWSVVEDAAIKVGYDKAMAQAVFPEKLEDVLRFFSFWADQKMVEELEKIDTANMGVRERVETAVIKRFKVLEPYKESVRAKSVYWLSPFRKIAAAKIIWTTSDVIWEWAGDQATDYNRYTKRGLLSGVLVSTSVAWLNDTSDNHQETLAFLERRLDNVLKVGKFIGKFKSRQAS